MDVILKQDVKGIGKKGELKKVAEGHARNFLLPRGLAVEATADEINKMKNRDSAAAFHKAEDIAKTNEEKAKIDGNTISIKAKMGANGRLFGAVTSKEIAAIINDTFGVSIDKKKISVADIKDAGTYTAAVKLPHGISAKVNVDVVAE